MLLEQFFNDCFKKNKAHAREGKHAVTFTECRKVANQVLAANEVKCQWKTYIWGQYPDCIAQVTCFTNYFSGDPYIGSNREEIKKKNIRIAELEAEVKKLKFEGSRSGLNNNNSKGRGFGRSETAEDKKKRYSQDVSLPDNLLSKVDIISHVGKNICSSEQMFLNILCRTCRDWNEGTCTRKGSRVGQCGFGQDSRKHGCANILDRDSICWSADHTEKECPK